MIELSYCDENLVFTYARFILKLYFMLFPFSCSFQLNQQCGFGQHQKENGDIPKGKQRCHSEK